MLSIKWYIQISKCLTLMITNFIPVWIGVFVSSLRPKHINLRNWLKFVNRWKNSDLFILKEVFYDKAYTPDFFTIWDHDVVVDIWGQMWSFSILAAGITDNNVYSFEPFDENFLLFQENLKLNNINNVVLEPYGLWAKEKTVEFYIHPENSGWHSIYNKYPKDVVTEIRKIKVISFNSYFEKMNLDEIHFMKIDCEGAEYEILLNMKDNILKKISKIVMELEEFDDKKPVDMIAFLEKHNFECSYRWWLLFARNTVFIN